MRIEQIFIGLIILIYLGLYIYYELNIIPYRNLAKEFNRGMTKIIMKNPNNYQLIIKELELLYRETEFRHPKHMKRYKSLKSILESTFTGLYCKNDRYLKRFELFRLKDKRYIMSELVEIVAKKHPFSNLNNNQEWLLETINGLLENKGESDNYVFKQLATEINSLNNSIEKGEKQNRISVILSTIGVILTIFFGIMTFV